MRRNAIPTLTCSLVLALTLALALAPTALATTPIDLGDTAQDGPPPLRAVGPLAFGPDGILFVGDSQSAAVFALDTTDLAYLDGQLLVTGLSNEEFSSKLHTLSFPFAAPGAIGAGSSLEIFHGAHGRWETHAPVRTLTLYDIGTAPHVLAAYTCTPLVKFPLAELATSQKLTGTTVAELGNRNRPLDMVVYEKDGRDWLLVANSSRGVMKVDLAEIAKIEGITERVADVAGLSYETLGELQGVQQLDRFDQERALVLIEQDRGLELATIELP